MYKISFLNLQINRLHTCTCTNCYHLHCIIQVFFIILGVHVDDMNDFYTEEVLEEDGEVVEYFGYDQPAV